MYMPFAAHTNVACGASPQYAKTFALGKRLFLCVIRLLCRLGRADPAAIGRHPPGRECPQEPALPI